MAVVNVLVIVAGIATLFLLPAWLMALRYRQGTAFEDPADAAAGILGFAVIVTPVLLFLGGALSMEPLGWGVCGATSAALILLMHRQVAHRVRIARDRRDRAARTVAWDGWTIGVFTLAGILAILQFALLFDSAIEFNWGCTYRPCATAIGLGTPYGLKPLNSSLFYMDHQRMGVTALISPFMSLFGMTGVRVFWALIMALLPLTTFATCRKLGLAGAPALFAAAVAAGLPAVVGVQDQNRILLSITGFLAYLMVTRLDRPLMLGGVLAIAWAAEPALIVTSPVLLLILLTDSSRFWRAKATRRRAFVRLATGFLVVGFPFMFRMLLVSGSPLGHEHFSYNPSYDYSFLGIPFTLNAYLNWPFHDHLVRSLYNPLPNLALVPLSILNHLGLILATVTLYGFLVLLVRRRYRLFGTLFAWFALMAGSLAFIENWTEMNKWDIVVMAYVPLFIACGFGIDSLAGGRQGRVGRIAVLAGLAGLLALGRHGLTLLDAPVDSRLLGTPVGTEGPGVPEDPTYMAFERHAIRDVSPWPGKSREGRLDGDQLRSNLSAALRDLPSIQAADWHLSASEALLLVFMRQEEYPEPIGFDREVAAREARALPEAFTLDLRLPPTAGVDGNVLDAVERPPCTGPTTHLYPYNHFSSMKVDWNPEPIQIGVFVGDGHGLGMLVLVRQRYDLEEQADIPPGCITVHLPPGTTVDLLDCVSNDPSRL